MTENVTGSTPQRSNPLREMQLSRREILGIAAGAAAAIGRTTPARLFADDPAAAGPTAEELVAGKDPRLVVHNVKSIEMETPIAVLREQPVTSKQILFVRNNQALANSQTIEPPAKRDWTVELTGMVEYPREISLARLRELPQVESEMVLQCSGNGRAIFSETAPAKGSQWRRGAMGNVKFRGVSLKQLIEALAPNVDPAAKFLTAEGRDEAASEMSADFEHSLPLSDALARSILALELNDEPLPAVHGGPVRLVTPGYYGTMHIKWLERLRFEADETFNHHQSRRYRTPYEPIAPGSEFKYSPENSEPNWRMRIKSVIFAPLEGEKLAAGNTRIAGVAFNDGSVPIESVLVSIDNGRTWRRAELAASTSPYAWRHWSLELALPAGAQEIIARAIDALGRSQPLDCALQWNPSGYGYSAADRIQVKVT